MGEAAKREDKKHRGDHISRFYYFDGSRACGIHSTAKIELTNIKFKISKFAN